MARFLSLAVVLFAMVYSVLAFPHIRQGRDLQGPYFNGTAPVPPYGEQLPPPPPPPPAYNGTASPANGSYVTAYKQHAEPVRRNIRNFPISLRVPGRA